MRSSYVLTRPVANEYLVRERDRRRLIDLLAIAIATALVAGGALSYTWVRQQILTTGYSIDRLENHLAALGQEKRELSLREAQLTALPRIARRAAVELGLRQPAPEQLVVLDPQEPPAP